MAGSKPLTVPPQRMGPGRWKRAGQKQRVETAIVGFVPPLVRCAVSRAVGALGARLPESRVRTCTCPCEHAAAGPFDITRFMPSTAPADAPCPKGLHRKRSDHWLRSWVVLRGWGRGLVTDPVRQGSEEMSRHPEATTVRWRGQISHGGLDDSTHGLDAVRLDTRRLLVGTARGAAQHSGAIVGVPILAGLHHQYVRI